MDQGMDFASVAQESLVDTLGETPSEVLFKMIGKMGVSRPEVFIDRISRVLGEGSRDLLSAVEGYATRWRELRVEAAPESAYESLMGSLAQVAAFQTNNGGTILLHNHRVKDEFGLYAEDS